MIYDSGDYDKAMDTALALVGLEGLRQAPARISASTASCAASGSRTTSNHQRLAARVVEDRPCSRRAASRSSIGTLSSGQGHETSFAQCVSEWLGVPFEQRQADPGRHRHRAGRRRLAFRPLDAAWRRSSWASASNAIIAEGKRIAGHVLETEPDEVEFKDGRFTQRRAPTARSTCSRSRARRADAQRPAGRPARAARGRERPAFHRRRLSRTAARSARSRSIPTPARSRSCATPRSTTSAARSIR